MYRVASCLTTEHDLWLVGLAVLVCIATTLTAFIMYEIASANRDHRRLMWAGLSRMSRSRWGHALRRDACLRSLAKSLRTIFDRSFTRHCCWPCRLRFCDRGGWQLHGAGLGGVVLGGAIGTMHYVGMPGSRGARHVGLGAWPRCSLPHVRSHHRSGGHAGIPFQDRLRGILLGGGLLTLAICSFAFHRYGGSDNPARSNVVPGLIGCTWR